MKKRLLASVIATALGLAAAGMPAAAISDAGCKGLAKARGFITVDLRGSAIEQHLATVAAAVNGEGTPEFFIYVPRVQLPNDCKGGQLP